MDFPAYSNVKEWNNSFLAAFETTKDVVYEAENCQGKSVFTDLNQL